MKANLTSVIISIICSSLAVGTFLVGTVSADEAPITSAIVTPVTSPIITPVTAPVVTLPSTSSVLQPPAPSYNTQAPICGANKPTSAPVLLAATATGLNQVTLTWSLAADPVSYYLVAYGTSSGKLEYGNPNVGDKNTFNFTVRGLSGNKTYYFKVRAGNDCMPGPFSNELSAKANGPVISHPAAGFSQGVLATQVNSQNSEVTLKYRPVNLTQSQRLLGSGLNLLGTILNFFASIFAR